jgi:signal peptidase II
MNSQKSKIFKFRTDSFNSILDLRLYIMISIAIFILDQASKRLIENGIIKIPYIYNKGAALGLFRDLDSSIRIPFFIVFSLIALVVILFYMFTVSKEEKITMLSLSLILGGAFGNFLDRIMSGRVIDFIDTGIWPTFNIADSAISTGVCILVISTLFLKKESDRAKDFKTQEKEK